MVEQADEVRGLEEALSLPLPADYRSFLREHGGTEGLFGDVYLVLWSARQAKECNTRDYVELRHYAADLVLIGSDGAGEAVAFDFRDGAERVVLLPFISTGWEDAAPQANSFAEFMEQRRRGDPFLFESYGPQQ